jgi:cell division septation protein DedD
MGTAAFIQNEGDGFLERGWGRNGPGFGMPTENFSARFVRMVNFECGLYRFNMVADDGDRFFVDDAIKLDEWTSRPSYNTFVDVQIPQGIHFLRVEYNQQGGETALSLKWQQLSPCASYDGDLVVNSGQTMIANTVLATVNASGTSATPSTWDGFYPGDLVYFHQSQGAANAGRGEMNQIVSINGPNSWTLLKPLNYNYDSVNGKAQVVKVPQYDSVTVQAGGLLTAPAWDGSTGGILMLVANGNVLVNGSIDMSAKGFRGGNGTSSSGREGQQGEGYLRPGSNLWDNRPVNGNGGGGGSRQAQTSMSTGGGGGGGNGTPGGSGWNWNGSDLYGAGGSTAGSPDLTTILFGGGGGQGGNSLGNMGGNGGGIIMIYADQLTVPGSIVSNGVAQVTSSGGNQDGNGGGGAGGSILLSARSVPIGTAAVSAIGGSASSGTVGPSGAGGDGRVRLEYCESLTGSTVPAASVQQTCATPATPTPGPTSTPTPIPPTATSSPTPTLSSPSPTPTITPTPSSTIMKELLTQPMHLVGNNGAAEQYQNIDANALNGENMLRVTCDLHGLSPLGGDASALIFDQNGWQYVSLSNYLTPGVNGLQTVDIPLTDFSGLNPNTSVGTLHSRFWYSGAFSVDITSVKVYSTNGSVTPTPLPPTATPSPTAQPNPTPGSTSTALPTATPSPSPVSTGVQLLTQPWHLTPNNGAAEQYQNINPNVLQGKTTLRSTYDLHGFTVLGGDASAIIFDQNGWKYISLSDYGQNGKDGSQTVDIPLSAFGLDLNSPVDLLHARFWYGGSATIDITSILVL